MAFFHGVESFNVPGTTTPVRQVDTAIIGLVGVFPKGPINTLTYVTSVQGTEQFGDSLYPMQGTESLRHIYEEDPGAKVLVVNVYDPSTVSDEISQEAATITNGKAQLANTVLKEAGSVVVAGGSPWATFVEGTDYTISDLGVLKIIPSGDIVEGDTVYVDYFTHDVSGLTASDFVGTTSPARTGFKLFLEAFDTFGVQPKIFACPRYSAIDAVANEIESQCDAFRARAWVDEEEADTVAELVTARNTAGKSTATVSRRINPVGPWVKNYNYLGQLETYPFSMAMTGKASANARENGYWVSPSNNTMKTVVSPEYPLLGTGPNDATGDIQTLNAAGISSIVKIGGSYNSYGNRSAAYPTDTAPENFIAVQWVDDIITHSIEFAMIPFIDKPLNDAFVDSVLGTVNAFIATKIQEGALLDGSNCYYDPADNSAVDLAAGQVTFRRFYASPTPAERITFKSTFDINLLTNIS